MSAEAKTSRMVLQNKIRVNKTKAALAGKAGDHSAAAEFSAAADEQLAELLSGK